MEPNEPAFVRAVRRAAEAVGLPIRQAGVFCTDSIFCEYAHLDFIKSFGVDLIEMETAAFHTMAGLLEKPAVALLVVSDNSATNEPLIGKPTEQVERYQRSISQIFTLLVRIGKMLNG